MKERCPTCGKNVPAQGHLTLMDCPKLKNQVDNNNENNLTITPRNADDTVTHRVTSRHERATQTANEIRGWLTNMTEAIGHIGPLLALAQDEEHWKELGYASWTAYLDGEYEVSRQNLYRVLRQERVSQALGFPVSQRQAQALNTPESLEQVQSQMESGATVQEAIESAIADSKPPKPNPALPRKEDPKVTDPTKEYEQQKSTPETTRTDANRPPPITNIYIDTSNLEDTNEEVTSIDIANENEEGGSGGKPERIENEEENSPRHTQVFTESIQRQGISESTGNSELLQKTHEREDKQYTYPPDFEGTIARLPGFVRRNNQQRIANIEEHCREKGIEPIRLYEKFADFYRAQAQRYGWKDPGAAFIRNYHRSLEQLEREQKPSEYVQCPTCRGSGTVAVTQLGKNGTMATQIVGADYWQAEEEAERAKNQGIN